MLSTVTSSPVKAPLDAVESRRVSQAGAPRTHGISIWIHGAPWPPLTDGEGLGLRQACRSSIPINPRPAVSELSTFQILAEMQERVHRFSTVLPGEPWSIAGKIGAPIVGTRAAPERPARSECVGAGKHARVRDTPKPNRFASLGGDDAWDTRRAVPTPHRRCRAGGWVRQVAGVDGHGTEKQAPRGKGRIVNRIVNRCRAPAWPTRLRLHEGHGLFPSGGA